ncbi:diaminopimelate decarboxylase [Desulfovibrio sp. PG-178-WT-4]|uniref:Diaminopimelate decarboxylase n=1 Tax=Desulfovibrio porci TaxID=2605782 RepID=A0A6L5XII1_9BACT|nr:diaminopimelate decarboxylase [Desulfovibrio porci]MSS26993.1 diaminopimelate decarboxylase [Desulfovibrio porci]
MPMPDVEALLKRHGFPLYIYARGVISGQIARLKDVFSGFDILYSMKCNHNDAVCRHITADGIGIDAASRNEVLAARVLGVPRDKILFSAPGKSDEDLAETLDDCLIIADSYNELRRIDALCAGRGIVRPVGLRVSPAIAYGPGLCPAVCPGLPDKFGEDEEELPAYGDFLRGLKHARPAGIHIHVRSQVLSAEALGACFEHAARLARVWNRDLGLPLEFVNFGGGLGIPYVEDAPSLDLAALRGYLAGLLRTPPRDGDAPVRRYMESGRFLVGKAGIFATRIVDVKRSRGKTFVIAAGLLNHFLRPAIAGLLAALPLERAYDGPCEPLWSGRGTVAPKAFGRPAPARTVTVCGNLCTAMDTVARDIVLENAVVGNVLVFENAGAYAAALSPHDFSGRPGVKEILWG